MDADDYMIGDVSINHLPIKYTVTQRGRTMLVYDGYKYVTNRQSAAHVFWRCSRYSKFKCRATMITGKQQTLIRYKQRQHTHAEEKFSAKQVLIDVTDTLELNRILSETENEKRQINSDDIS
jgi:FLYWCH zinc finger domain